MHSMEHKSIGIYTCPKQKHDTMRTTKHNSKHHKTNKKTNRTKFSYYVNVFSPWYMYLSYGISLPLQMCMRNKISPLKDVYKSHIEMTKYTDILSRVYSPPFCQEQTKGQEETRARDEGTNNANDA